MLKNTSQNIESVGKDKKSENYIKSFRNDLSKRLVRTFFDLFLVLLMFRNSKISLLLSELGGYICGFAHAPAGTKRLSNLLRSKKWSSELIDNFFFSRSKDRANDLKMKGKRPLVKPDEICSTIPSKCLQIDFENLFYQNSRLRNQQ